MELGWQTVGGWDRQHELQAGMAGSEAFAQNSKFFRRLALVVIQFSEESAAGSVFGEKNDDITSIRIKQGGAQLWR